MKRGGIMATVNVYEQYFEAEGIFNGRMRHGALVMLTADSEKGNITYKAAVSFFPHDDEDDYAVSYDAYFESVMYQGKGRRSKKREQNLMEELQPAVGRLASENSASVFWDRPLREERRG